MDSTSATTVVDSFAFQEIDYLVMIVMTAFIGWRMAEMVRRHCKKLSKSNASKKSFSKNKLSEDTVEQETVMSQIKYTADCVQINQKAKGRIPLTQMPAVRAAVQKSAALEQPVAGIRTPPGLQAPSGLPAPLTTAMKDAPWRKDAASATPVASREDNDVPRQLGRVVCWKETGYGFIVNEAGERLFVRQGEVEGGEQLRAGQLVWFRRGKAQPGQAAKALSVSLVSQDAAKALRHSALAASPSSKSQNKALAFPTAPKKDGESLVTPPTLVTPEDPTVQTCSSDAGSDEDLGAGSKEEQIKNLKSALQWAADKFSSEQGQ